MRARTHTNTPDYSRVLLTIFTLGITEYKDLEEKRLEQTFQIYDLCSLSNIPQNLPTLV